MQTTANSKTHKHSRYLSISESEKTMISGGIAGSVGKTCTAPLSRLTILYQVSPLLSKPSNDTAKLNISSSDSLIKTCRNIIRNEGFLGFWKGNFTSVIHRFPYSAINFSSYEMARTFLSDGSDGGHDSPVLRFVCGGFSGLTAATCCYPLELVRTRLTVANTFASNNNLMPNNNRLLSSSKILSTMSQIYHQDGFLGLYRGLSVSLCVSIPTLAIGFTMYGFVKDTLMDYGGIFVNKETGHVTSYGSLLSGSASGITSSCILFPVDVIRKRLQVYKIPASEIIKTLEASYSPSSSASGGFTKELLLNPNILINKQVNPILSHLHYQHSIQQSQAQAKQQSSSNKFLARLKRFTTANEIIFHSKEIISESGVRGLYRGLLPELLKVCPMVAITFCTYETTLDLLNSKF